MDNGRDDKTKPLISSLKLNKQVVVEKVLGMEEREEEEEEESKRLLSPRNEEISPKPKRKVQWNDTNGGNKLAEVVEFLPSNILLKFH
ncbi:uncharacterized protein LOC130809807 isoform X2 [Amaranthus tricolor]|uniref:uncharacterized protein LOC130809807 isoform X2 n=1 Tax=Amaranthus tricolor TaxID=29722 RepID=UPI002584BA43|nr:uncharacterized protein LOC130809807 isoform X2 [Amaranthus tricolor]